MKKKLITSIVILIAGIGLSNGQGTTIDYSFMFSDKFGMNIGYEFLYITSSKSQLNNLQKEKLFNETKKIVSACGREIDLVDFYFKRDSVEKVIIDNIMAQVKKNHIKVKEVSIINLIMPKQVLEALNLRATSLNEPKPTRIKSSGN